MKRILLPCLFVAFPLAALAVESASTPAWDAAQVEADWARQEELRFRETASTDGSSVPVEEDARGGCDGVIDGKWGFHTLNEDQPWWQVDLGASLPLGEIRLFNRCDGFASRNDRIRILLSDDARQWTEAYQHDGPTFYGKPDGKPLIVSLGGADARYVRLQLPGKSYFHLDEVQIHPPVAADTTNPPTTRSNLALGKSATQSSTSTWSVRHPITPVGNGTLLPTRTILERGLKLAAALRSTDTDTDVTEAERTFHRVLEALDTLDAGTPAPGETTAARQRLYMEARWATRRLALSNPLLDFDAILFVKRAPPLFPHMSDQFYGWWSRGGGGIFRLDGLLDDSPDRATVTQRVRCLTADWREGTFLRPDISHDGRRVLFAYCRYYPDIAGKVKVHKDALPEDTFFHLFEMNVDGTNVRRLTHGRYDDFDGRYLPDGRIVFLSTRKGQFLRCSTADVDRFDVGTTLPDSFVRCGGGDTRPVAVFTLHAMNGDGKGIHPISAFENFEWTPAVTHDGRIVYARWDYIDRHNGPYLSLWSTNPDGTNSQLVYGNYTVKPQCVFEARPIPGSTKLIFTAAAHHSNMGGSLVLLDRTRGSEFESPLQRITPEVSFPETEGWPKHFYSNPYPLSERFHLVSWGDRPLPPHSHLKPDDPRNPPNAQGIYLYDTFGNLELLHRDPEISCMYPLPIRPRALERLLPNAVVDEPTREGRFLLQNVYRGLEELPRGSVRRLRVIAMPPKVQPHMNRPLLGVSREDPGKYVLGTVPVERDGSAYFRVPAGVPVLFQALDADGMAVQTMRSIAYVQPGQTFSCIGCHESRDVAPPSRSRPLAARREPSKLRLDPPGSWPLRFDELVQPVLDRHCVGCHQPGEKDPAAAAVNLTAGGSYQTLLDYADGDLKKLAFEKPRSLVGDCPARQSKLLALLTAEQGHAGVHLDEDSFRRLVTWMDTYAHFQGAFSPEQEEGLRRFRVELGAMLTE